MKKNKITVTINKKQIKLDILKIESSDKAKLRTIFKRWLELSNLLKSLGSRGVNIPEGLTESLFCLEMNSARVIKAYNSKGSFDTINRNNNKRQQVKATSSSGPTSFGPNSFWDENELYLMDFVGKDGIIDGTFSIYRILDKYIYLSKVNKTERLSDQQAQKRRPRMDLRKDVVIKYKLKPIKKGSIV
ncbi:MAG: Bsp6I family type II restriction endonuclease [Candidatus Paceibacterota bacterium]|jgi:hypothetical protein